MDPTRVYLVRHGKAERDAPGGDAARRLTPEGRARFGALARALEKKLRISRIVTSPLARARETAEILSAATGAPVEEEPELAAGRSDARRILELARAAGAGVALVGHNPELAEAVQEAAGEEVKVRPGTVAALDLLARSAQLAWLEAPERDGEPAR